jgi:hypothetical protein
MYIGIPTAGSNVTITNIYSLGTAGNVNIGGALTLGTVLSVGNGGTGTTTAFTAGSVIFAGTSGVYSQDNATFFWNTSTKRLGLGTSNPGGAIGDERLRVTGTDSDSWPVAVEDSAGTVAAGFYAASNIAGTGTFSNDPFLLLCQNSERARLDSSGNVVINTAAIATNATNGFLYVPSCAGTPTGTPTAYTGRVPIVVDTSANKLYFYSTGAWRDAGP